MTRLPRKRAPPMRALDQVQARAQVRLLSLLLLLLLPLLLQ